jgi:hypothetical protein
MIEIIGNLWEQEANAICITTNGFVKKDGRAVMGRGCAKEALDRYPGIDKKLGVKLLKHKFNNIPHLLLEEPKWDIVSFPVKPKSAVFDGNNAVSHLFGNFKIGDFVPGWACKADLELIKKSAELLVKRANYYNYQKVILPRPGCGAGELKWEDVKPILKEILDDRFYVITFGE